MSSSRTPRDPVRGSEPYSTDQSNSRSGGQILIRRAAKAGDHIHIYDMTEFAVVLLRMYASGGGRILLHAVGGG